MSVAFMALLSSVASECIHRKLGSSLLLPLVSAGAFSVLFWFRTEQAGHGDLRLYALVQFLPVALVPLMLLLYRPGRTYEVPLWQLVILYMIAKAFELLDGRVYAVTQAVSGHTMKHLIAALGAALMVRMLRRREREVTAPDFRPEE
jgi:hypothetical protein